MDLNVFSEIVDIHNPHSSFHIAEIITGLDTLSFCNRNEAGNFPIHWLIFSRSVLNKFQHI